MVADVGPSENPISSDAADDEPVVNQAQADAWDGNEGEHWVANQHRHETLGANFTPRLIDAAAIRDHHRVLDIGCGCGQTTRLAAQRASRGHALGVDLSTLMLERARADAAADGIDNATFERADAQVHRFPGPAFHVAMSRFGVMFFEDPIAAFTNIGTALGPGGRLAFLCWQDVAHNEWVAVPAGAALAHIPFPDLGSPDEPGPFSLADPSRIDEVLTQAGFEAVSTEAVEAPMRLGSDADDAVAFLSGIGLARSLLESVDSQTAARALDEVREALRAYERPDGLELGGAAWLVTAQRP